MIPPEQVFIIRKENRLGFINIPDLPALAVKEVESQ